MESQERLGPETAFARFAEIVASPKGLITSDPDEFLRLLEPFLLSPRHAPHVEFMMRALHYRGTLRTIDAAAKNVGIVGGIAGKVVGSRWVYGRAINRAWKKWVHETASLQAELANDLIPGEVTADLLPARKLLVPEEWQKVGRRGYLLEARIDVASQRGFEPDMVSVIWNMRATDEFGVIDSAPKTQFTQEAEITSEGKLVDKVEAGTKSSLGVKAKGVGISIEESRGESSERSSMVSLTGKLTALRLEAGHIILKPGYSRARWIFWRTGEQAPVGGQSLVATVFARQSEPSINATITVEADYAGWGTIRETVRRKIDLYPEPSGKH